MTGSAERGEQQGPLRLEQGKIVLERGEAAGIRDSVGWLTGALTADVRQALDKDPDAQEVSITDSHVPVLRSLYVIGANDLIYQQLLGIPLDAEDKARLTSIYMCLSALNDSDVPHVSGESLG